MHPSYIFLLSLFFPPVAHEFQFVLGILQYTQARLSAGTTIESARKICHLQVTDASVGSFLNLHCGHNNPFSRDERKTLKAFLEQATAGAASG
jgi:hypothetical protein